MTQPVYDHAENGCVRKPTTATDSTSTMTKQIFVRLLDSLWNAGAQTVVVSAQRPAWCSCSVRKSGQVVQEQSCSTRSNCVCAGVFK